MPESSASMNLLVSSEIIHWSIVCNWFVLWFEAAPHFNRMLYISVGILREGAWLWTGHNSTWIVRTSVAPEKFNKTIRMKPSISNLYRRLSYEIRISGSHDIFRGFTWFKNSQGTEAP